MDQRNVSDLAGQLDGSLQRPGDAEYDTARTLWNSMIDKRPALIARCASTEDVVASVCFAREHDMLVSVRGGGHNVAGNAVCDDGLMIDLTLMNKVEVNSATRRVTAQGGCTLGAIDSVSHEHGLAVPAGIISETGVGGLALGGGVGWLVRKYGMTCDNIVSAEVVIADGRVLRASASEHADLYWGLRGGGGNFGIVTAFEFQAHPVNTVIGGMIIHPRAGARDVFRFYRDFTKQAPIELTAYCACLTTPDGVRVTALMACYCGDPAMSDAALKPMREFGSPIADTMAEIPRIEMQTMFDAGFPYGNRNYWKSSFMDELTDDAIDLLVDHANRMTSPLSAVMIEYYFGGPSSEIGETETAFAHRDAQFDLGIIGQWQDPAEDSEHMNWARTTYDALQPHCNGRIYANLMGGDQMTEETQLRSAFGVNYDRLVTLKRKYDPTNFFRLNQNIKP
ncbi:MAG: FAD-binding oxidoreductase [Proteobacteria bacterium]|nr:FAD-binding oxidoreductase [Pseudomonadota bacterium]